MAGAAISVASLALLTAVQVARHATADHTPAVATVNGAAITQQELERYAAVFRSPDGRLTLGMGQVLLSLANQSLISQEAATRGIHVSEQAVDEAMDHWSQLGVGQEALADAGGVDGLRGRFRAFLEMRQVKDQVVGAVVVAAHEIEMAYQADSSLAGLAIGDVTETLRRRLTESKRERVWVSWLADRRSCATIVVFDESLGMAFSSPRPGC